MKKLWVEINEAIPAIAFSENAPSADFIDKSDDIELWDSVTSIMDWSRRRDKILPLFYAIASVDLSTYGNLTAAQKLIGAKYFLAPYSLRVTNGIVTEDEDKANWQYLLTETKKSRLSCIEAMRLLVGDKIRIGGLTLSQTQQFYVDVYQFVIWFEQCNMPDLKQWTTNEVGSAYENNGFAEKSYFTTGLRDELMDIYNDNY